ncbi:hypothetical protein FH972_026483 [Carpinus fangiana]|uniref:Uncharacterized protein n=1 Tax=Carpinus fangiana TaxID=176857 RepID=A0A5N6L6M8_9ROSI|nr:hypothetical protein FH972_026483 [Carpinus fangiana]
MCLLLAAGDSGLRGMSARRKTTGPARTVHWPEAHGASSCCWATSGMGSWRSKHRMPEQWDAEYTRRAPFQKRKIRALPPPRVFHRLVALKDVLEGCDSFGQGRWAWARQQ